MATFNYNTGGVGANLQFGINGGRIVWNTDHFESTSDGVTLTQMRVATTPVNNNDAASKGYVDIAASSGGVQVDEEGTSVVAAASEINFVGNSVTVTDVAGVATVTTTNIYEPWVMYPAEAVALDQILELPFNRTVTFQNNFAGSTGYVETNPAASYVMSIERDAVAIGTITISTAGVFTFATTAGTTEVFTSGQRLTVRAPAVADGTIDTLSLVLAGTR